MTGFESFVGVNPWTALFTFCNMLITFAVLKKNTESNASIPCCNQAVCQQALGTIVIRNSLNATI